MGKGWKNPHPHHHPRGWHIRFTLRQKGVLCSIAQQKELQVQGTGYNNMGKKPLPGKRGEEGTIMGRESIWGGGEDKREDDKNTPLIK